jgi:hypothetical protein
MEESTQYYFSKRKPRTCPNCGSKKIARIQWGMPVLSDELRKGLDSGSIVLGGCCVTDCDPSWMCIKCETTIYRDSLKDRLNNQGAF